MNNNDFLYLRPESYRKSAEKVLRKAKRQFREKVSNGAKMVKSKTQPRAWVLKNER